MKNKFQIGELSKIFDISTDTLRHYDRIGLLKPEYDEKNHYRYYSLRHFFVLSRILFFKSLDVSLGDIKAYMHQKNTLNLLSLLRKKEEDIDVKLHRLMNLKHKIQTKRMLLESIDQQLNSVSIKAIPERKGIFLKMNATESDFEIKQAFKESEKYLKTSSWLIEGQVYTSVSQESLLNKQFTQFRYFLEIIIADEDYSGKLTTIPAQDYACVTFLGPYRDMSTHYSALTQWIADNGYHIAGDSIEKNIVDYDFSDSENEYISEIQIPITRCKQAFFP